MHTKCDYAQIIQEHTFSEAIDQLHNSYTRMSDVHAAIDFALGKQPLLGTSCYEEPDHYVFKTTGIGNTPSFWVLYRYDENTNTIYVLSISPSEVEE